MKYILILAAEKFNFSPILEHTPKRLFSSINLNLSITIINYPFVQLEQISIKKMESANFTLEMILKTLK